MKKNQIKNKILNKYNYSIKNKSKLFFFKSF